MENDLKYPEGLIAKEHWERPISELKEGVGAMPGEPLQEIEPDTLISGRGLVP